MTDAILPIAAAASAEASQSPRPDTASPQKAGGGTRLEVSRAEAAPVFVYRVLDNDTGRILVEIPRESAAASARKPGSVVDTWA